MSGLVGKPEDRISHDEAHLCRLISTFVALNLKVVVVVFGFYIPPTAKVIWRWDLGLKSRPKDRNLISENLSLVYFFPIRMDSNGHK